ncbi:MAG: biotin--[acetyl-CoA-carboxylase] ligase [Gammaproteobacteria bacterium]|nr:biotin--[acetyl-CoA-carboxylase] ligase [Gammaproteobacteria bacterium]
MAECLDVEQIRQCLGHDCELALFAKTDSTNEQALLMVKQGAVLPLACFAEEQTQGRGRRGKVWVSPPGGSIYLSLAWPFDLPVSELGSLSLVVGVAVARVLKRIGLEQVRLKWPNDVLVEDRKIAGILIETAQLTTQTTIAIIGVGLNFKLPEDMPVEPDQPWIDVVSSLGASLEARKIERSRLAGLLLQECMSICGSFLQVRHDVLLEYQQQYDICMDQPVNIYLEQGLILQGVVVGLESSGEIRVLVDGRQRLFNSADISLRKKSNVND